MKTISIATQKGGVGKTTSVIELASAFSITHDKKVLIIDFDQQCNLTKYVDAGEYTKTIYDALNNPEIVEECIIKSKDFDFIPGSPKLSKADIEFSDSDDVFILDDVLDKISGYDIILIDNGPQRNKLLQMIYVTSDYVICPTDDTEGGSDGLINVNNDIVKMRTAKIPLSQAKIIGSIITRAKVNTTLNKAVTEMLVEVMKEINPKGFVLSVRETVRASEAKFARMSLQRFEPYNNASIDYRLIAKKILEYMDGDENE